MRYVSKGTVGVYYTGGAKKILGCSSLERVMKPLGVKTARVEL